MTDVRQSQKKYIYCCGLELTLSVGLIRYTRGSNLSLQIYIRGKHVLEDLSTYIIDHLSYISIILISRYKNDKGVVHEQPNINDVNLIFRMTTNLWDK